MGCTDVFNPKKDRTVRFISNFCELNKRIKQKPHSIPKIQDLSLLSNQQIQDKITNNILGPRFLSSKATSNNHSVSSDKKFGPNSNSIEIQVKNDENVLKIQNAKQNTSKFRRHRTDFSTKLRIHPFPSCTYLDTKGTKQYQKGS